MSRNRSSRNRKSRLLYGFVLMLVGVPSVVAAAFRAERLLDEVSPRRSDATAKTRPRGTSVPILPPTLSTASAMGKPVDPSIHLAMGVPTDDSPDDDHLMRKLQYALSYNSARNVANWVSWQLDETWFGPVPRHKGKFLEDRDLPQGFRRANHDDYTGSGFDRGHMVRSEERTRSAEDNRSTFLMTNILPQFHDLNAGPWLRLEEHCEKLVKRDGQQLFIMAGGVFARAKRAKQVIGRDVAVPGSFFKVVVILRPGQGAKDVQTSTPVIAVTRAERRCTRSRWRATPAPRRFQLTQPTAAHESTTPAAATSRTGSEP